MCNIFNLSMSDSQHIQPNSNLQYLGTETAFGFGAKVAKIEAEKKFPIVYKFHIGDTGPKTPEPIIDVAVKALQDKQTKYASFLGFPAVRANIARHICETRGIDNITADNIMLEPGGKPAIELAIQAMVGPDEYIVGQNPGFPIYESLARFYTQGRYIPWLAQVNSTTNCLEFKIEDLEAICASGKKIKLLIVNTPQNPTGMILDEAKVRAIGELAKKHQFMVLFDDIYDQIIFDNKKHFSLLSVSGMLDYTINLNGYSKDFAMTGWRIGFVVAPKWGIDIFGQLAINKWSCVSRPYQIVAGAIFGDVEVEGCKYESVAEKIAPIVQADVAEYEKKGKFLVESLNLLAPYVVPNPVEGAFYDFPNIRGVLELPYVKNELKIENDKQFSDWMLNERGLAALAGSDFGEGGRGFLRLSYAEDREKHIIPGVKYFMKVIVELIEKSGLTPPITSADIDARVGEIEKKYF